MQIVLVVKQMVRRCFHIPLVHSQFHLVKSSWQCHQQFDAGLYCMHCLIKHIIWLPFLIALLSPMDEIHSAILRTGVSWSTECSQGGTFPSVQKLQFFRPFHGTSVSFYSYQLLHTLWPTCKFRIRHTTNQSFASAFYPLLQLQGAPVAQQDLLYACTLIYFSEWVLHLDSKRI